MAYVVIIVWEYGANFRIYAEVGVRACVWFSAV